MRSGLAAAALAALLAAPGVRADEIRSWPDVLQVFGGTHLGVRLDDVGDDDVSRLKLREARGARVEAVDPGTPAAEAGLRRDDVILSFDGEAVRSAAALARLVRETPAGRTVKIEMSRDGARQQVSVKLDERRRRDHARHVLPPEVPLLRELRPPQAVPRRLGIGYRDVGGDEAARLELARAEGVIVTSVEPGSPAEQAGLQKDDVIVAVGARRVPNGHELRGAIAGASPTVVVSVVRAGETRDLTVRFEPAEDGPKKM